MRAKINKNNNGGDNNLIIVKEMAPEALYGQYLQ
jgi:hypothetical protein